MHFELHMLYNIKLAILKPLQDLFEKVLLGSITNCYLLPVNWGGLVKWHSAELFSNLGEVEDEFHFMYLTFILTKCLKNPEVSVCLKVINWMYFFNEECVHAVLVSLSLSMCVGFSSPLCLNAVFELWCSLIRVACPLSRSPWLRGGQIPNPFFILYMFIYNFVILIIHTVILEC